MLRKSRRLLHCESLEDRRVMATLVNTTTMTYQDIDGDNVTVKFSKPVLTSLAQANSIFDFSNGTVNNSNAQKQQLREIDLGSLAAASGTTINVTAVVSSTNGGDGFATLGQILANLDLGSVTVDGDLGRFDAGDANTSTMGLAALTVQSLGRFGVSTGATQLTSVVDGRLGQLTVKGDIYKASVFVQGGLNGSIGPVTLNGSLIGDNIETGRIVASGHMGAVKIACDILGGEGGNSGSIEAQGKIASLTVSGSVRGGGGAGSGRISSFGGIGPVTIQGSIVGGDGGQSGSLYSEYAVTSFSVGGSILGGSGLESGAVEIRGDVGNVTITGNLKGAAAFGSGSVGIGGKISRLIVGGSLLGGSGGSSGSIASRGVGGVSKISGDLIGGAGIGSGALYITNQGINNLTIGGSLRGGSATFSGSIGATRITTLAIKGDILGGNATGSQDVEAAGSISASTILNLTVDGSIIAGVDATSGNFEANGAIRASRELKSLTVGGSLVGNSTHRVLIQANRQENPTGTSDLAIGSIKVNGRVEYTRIRAGLLFETGAENADAQIGSVIVGGNWIASTITAGISLGADGLPGTNDDAKLNGIGVKDVASVNSKINSITIGGQILGTANGGDHFGFVAEVLGSLKIGGVNIPLLAGKSNDNAALGPFADFRAREV
jgi:hypothetical protein